MKISIETTVNAPLQRVWDAWNDPAEITQWNSPSDDWHTTHSRVDLREGGTFLSRMEAKDGSAGFDFGGTYTRVVPQKAIEYRMGDGREVEVQFSERPEGVHIQTIFDAEDIHPPEYQQAGWQAILDRFGRHVEADR